MGRYRSISGASSSRVSLVSLRPNACYAYTPFSQVIQTSIKRPISRSSPLPRAALINGSAIDRKKSLHGRKVVSPDIRPQRHKQLSVLTMSCCVFVVATS